MRKDSFIGQEFYWFTGEIKKWEDNNKVKVYCHGYHPESAADEVNSLPSAHVMLPTTIGGTDKTAANHQLEEGSWVVGFFRDGPTAQDPIIIGSLPSKDDGGGTEDKKVYEFHGHKTEINKSNGQIKITHAIGSSITMDATGGITLSSAFGEKTTIL